MTLVAEARGTRLWRLWNTEYGYRPEVANEGFIVHTSRGWALFERGRQARERDTYSTLESALRGAGIDAARVDDITDEL